MKQTISLLPGNYLSLLLNPHKICGHITLAVATFLVTNIVYKQDYNIQKSDKH